MTSASIYTLLLIAILAVASSALGIWFGSRQGSSLRLVSLSGGVLVGLTLFWILPEVSGRYGWAAGPVVLAAGAAIVWLVDRFVYPVCPTCSHSHDHNACQTRLHGFAAPLIIAVGVHNLVDGFGIAIGQEPHSGALGRAVLWAIALHKLPEGLALGVMLRASLPSSARALTACVIAQAPMLAGGLIEILFTPFVNAFVIAALAGLAAGSFLYLGFHALHSEWKRRRAVPAFVAAFLGAGLAALVERLLA